MFFLPQNHGTEKISFSSDQDQDQGPAWVKNRMQVNKQKNSKKSRVGHQTGPVPRKAAAGDEAGRGGKGRGLKARVKAA